MKGWVPDAPNLGPFRFGSGATSDLTAGEREELEAYRHRHGFDRLDLAPTRILELLLRDGPPPPVPWSELSVEQLEALAAGATWQDLGLGT